MRQYSIDQVEVAWNSLDFKEGMAAGTTIVAASNASAWSNAPTGQGKVTRVFNPDDSGTVTILVDQTSTLHQQLLSIAAADRIPATRSQVYPLKIDDTSSGEKIVFQNAYISTRPDFSRGTDAVTFPWVFAYEKTAPEPNTNNTTNLVGS